MSEPVVLIEVSEKVATITLNRPAARNAINAQLASELGQALQQAELDPAVRVIVLTGAAPAFCAGADLKAIAKGESLAAADNADWGFAGVVQHWVAKPTIAAVNGHALGGGAEIAMSCDLIVAGDEVNIGFPEVKRGLMAAAGGVVRAPRQLGLRRALELALIGDPISAQTALDWGMINRVVPMSQVVTAAQELAQKIAQNAPFAVQQTKAMVHKSAAAGSEWDSAWTGANPWEANLTATMAVFSHPDAIEGPTAFAEKRAPSWKDS